MLACAALVATVGEGGRARAAGANPGAPPVTPAVTTATPAKSATPATSATSVATSATTSAAAPVCLVLPLSGPHGALGERVARAAGRVLGAAGLPVRRVDDRGDVAAAGEAVARAVDEGCVAAIGGLGDDEARAVGEAAASQGLPLLALGAVPDQRARNGVVWARTSRAEPIAALATRLAAKEGVSSAILLAPGSRYGRAAFEAFRAAFEAAGGRVAVTRVLGPGEDDPKAAAKAFGALVREARSTRPCGPEVVFLPMDADGARRWLGFLEGEGVVGPPAESRCPRPVVAGASPWADPAGLARSGAALEGGRFGDVRVTGEDPGTPVLEAEAGDAARLLVALVRSAAGGRREDVRHAMEAGAAAAGATGSLRIEHGRVMGRDVATFTLRAGRPTVDEDAGGAGGGTVGGNVGSGPAATGEGEPPVR